MPAVQLTGRGPGAAVSTEDRVLARAAVAALGAPSILNTQPWNWRIGRATAELRADRSRQVTSIDAAGRLLTISCGVALHYARTALSSAGYDVDIAYLPDDADPDLLATIRIPGAHATRAEAVRLFRAMAVRRSDRRPFDARPVRDDSLERLRDAAEKCGAHLHLPRADEIVAITVAAGRAATVELNDPRYHQDLRTWVGPKRRSGDGIPSDTSAPPAARPVPIRDFTATGPENASIFDHLELGDSAARYAVLFTDGDEPHDWLAAGEALSAVLLTATADGLSSSMLSDLIEVESSRNILDNLLGHIGHPMVVVRVGYPASSSQAAAAPRRTAYDVIDSAAMPTDGP